MKAAARGTPAKFEATPEKVVVIDRNGPGRPPIETAHAMKEPEQASKDGGREADPDRHSVGARAQPGLTSWR